VGGAQTYTFTVTASNPNGSGPESAKSNAVTVAQAVAPDAPTGVSASPRLNSMLVSWTPGSTGGSPITKYTITPFVGSTALSPVTTDGSSPSATVSRLASGTNYTFTVTATNAVGTSPASAPSSAGTPLGSIFGATTPSIVDSGDDVPVELGMKFESDIAGTITGIRFYKAPANTGSHIGNLWTTDGTRLASGTFSNETSSGWQQLNFTTPVPIQAGTIYVASYFAPRGHYSYTASAFATAIDTPPLHAVADRISSDGVYAYGGASQFPTSTWNATNYWVDVVFSPGS
jgi:hypothetical protein